MIDFGPIDPTGSIFADDPANKEADTRTHEEHIESPGRRNHHRLPPTNLTKRETQFQHGDQDFSSSTQSLERNPTSNENNEINQNQILKTLAGALSGIWNEVKGDPREHHREITATINSAIEELNELQEEIRHLHYEEVGETR